MTLFYAVVAHAIIVLGIVFVPDDRPNMQYPTLDIVLVQSRSEKAPDDVDFLAQANQEGGGNHDERARPATPLPTPLTSREATVVAASAPIPPAPPAPPAKSVSATLPAPAVAPAKPVIAVVDQPSPAKVVTSAPQPKAKPTQSAAVTPESTSEPAPTQTLRAATLVERSLAMASLSAEIDQRLEAYAERPRRIWINARTQEYKYASYMEAWRLKVERIGNLNYPDEARRRRLSGSLLLEVVLNGDGTVNDIMLRRSSGHRVLDDAAIRIVQLAAPYAPLPDNILEDTDLLHIERTWRFLSTNQFAGS
jgi:protein TonB